MKSLALKLINAWEDGMMRAFAGMSAQDACDRAQLQADFEECKRLTEIHLAAEYGLRFSSQAEMSQWLGAALNWSDEIGEMLRDDEYLMELVALNNELYEESGKWR